MPEFLYKCMVLASLIYCSETGSDVVARRAISSGEDYCCGAIELSQESSSSNETLLEDITARRYK